MISPLPIERMRLAMLVLLLAFSSVGTMLSAASTPTLQTTQSVPGPKMIAEAGVEAGEAVAGGTEPLAGTTVSKYPDTVAEETPAISDRKDLTVFFFIGAVVDVLLVSAFLIWAVGQWRKAKK